MALTRYLSTKHGLTNSLFIGVQLRRLMQLTVVLSNHATVKTVQKAKQAICNTLKANRTVMLPKER